MIKFQAKRKNGITVFGFGLSDGNIERLKQGKPIYFALDELGLESHEVIILYGKTEEAITQELRKNGMLPPEIKS